ncbi:RNA pseudouridine synthase 4, mitochondrial [Nymphaea colorata]|nr:RNA pseudouridine synthase 4, mitochondrial [Nymphaea colorata]
MASRALLWRRVVSGRSCSPNGIMVPLEWEGCGASVCYGSSAVAAEKDEEEKRRKWFPLPRYSVQYASMVGLPRKGENVIADAATATTTTTTALKWVLRCCPNLPKSLIHKLFRLRQVRIQAAGPIDSVLEGTETRNDGRLLKRVSAKNTLNLGDRIFLPISNQDLPISKAGQFCSLDEINYIRSLEIYKDSAILVINKPPGMPVQGGTGVKISLDELAETLKYESSEKPRLVHRLDRDSSGVLVMGRTQASTLLLHSIFREKTSGATYTDTENIKKVLQKKYWALVLGTPRRTRGIISAPLAKVVVDGGKSQRTTIAHNDDAVSTQHAITEYQVLRSSSHGFTWLELSPLTGRKHQLRVHCAEALGTPIVGDYKYGWRAHKKWKPLPCPDDGEANDQDSKEKASPGLDPEKGSILDGEPALHLHCRQMIIPNVELALQKLQLSPNVDLLKVEMLDLICPLPSHMQRSWDLLCN